MVTCCALGCVNRSDRRYCRGVTFHKFPSEPVRRELWVQAVQRGEWQPANRSVLCSAHFNEEDFDRSSASTVRLRPTAVPSIFPEPKPKGKRTQVRSLAGTQFDAFFSLSAQICELSAAVQKPETEEAPKEELKEVFEEPNKVEEEPCKNFEEKVKEDIDPLQFLESSPLVESETPLEISKEVIGVKRKLDVVPERLSEFNSSITISKKPKTFPSNCTESILPHRFLEVQLDENETQRKVKPDILSQVMSCNENLAVTVTTVPSNLSRSTSSVKPPRPSIPDLNRINFPIRNSSPLPVQNKTPLPHEFLEVELKVLEEQQPVRLRLSDEISISKVSKPNKIPSSLTILPSVPRNMRLNFFDKFNNSTTLNQT